MIYDIFLMEGNVIQTWFAGGVEIEKEREESTMTLMFHWEFLPIGFCQKCRTQHLCNIDKLILFLQGNRATILLIHSCIYVKTYMHTYKKNRDVVHIFS